MLHRQLCHAWISYKAHFVRISHEIHVKMTWNIFMSISWENFHVNFMWKFSCHFHVKFPWILCDIFLHEICMKIIWKFFISFSYQNHMKFMQNIFMQISCAARFVEKWCENFTPISCEFHMKFIRGTIACVYFG